jgi:hypothetical protein
VRCRVNTGSFTAARPLKKSHYRHRPLLRACRERPSGRTAKKHDERARNKAEDSLTCIFLDNDLHFLDNDLVALV